MSFVKRNWLTAVVFVSGCIIVFLLIDFFRFDCQAIRTYEAVAFGDFFGTIGNVLGIVILAIIFFLLIKKKVSKQHYKKIKLCYFAVLPFWICFKSVALIPEKIKDKGIKQSICDKSTGNGMRSESKQLTRQEYGYLSGRCRLFPELPASAEGMDIEYHADDFLGDYYLKINFTCNINEQLDTLLMAKHWNVYERDVLNQRMSVEYSDSRN